jgi:hypothetical protein
MRRKPSPAPLLALAGVVGLLTACATSGDTPDDNSTAAAPPDGDDSSDASSGPDYAPVIVPDGSGDDSTEAGQGDDQGVIDDMATPDLGTPDVAPYDGGPTNACDPSNGFYEIEYVFDLIGGTVTPCSSACTSNSGGCCYMNLDCVPL